MSRHNSLTVLNTEQNAHIQMYCDGGCRGNQRRSNVGGWGVLLLWKDHKKELYGHARNTTNNIMELTACIEGLRAITNKKMPVDVYLDSAYVQSGITSWIYGWQKKKWRTSDGKPVLNKKLWLDLLAEKNKFTNINFYKVKGHADDPGNIRADELVNIAMDKFAGKF